MINDQGQHRISRVYLKYFAFKDHRNASMVCILEKGNPITQYKNIASFTVETNLFDSALADPEFMRYFEQFSSKIEVHYPKVINGLTKDNVLSKRNKEHLIRFVANILIRQNNFRDDFLIKIFEHRSVRSKLFNEITIFKDTRESDLKLYELIEDTHPPHEQMNLFAGEIWNHLVTVFPSFNFVILKARRDTCWFTSDNPVIIDRRDNIEAWILPPQSEIYFPLSKDFLLFMYNPRTPSENPIRNFKRDEVTECPAEIQDDIMMNKINRSVDRFCIIGEDLGIIDVRSGERYEPKKIPQTKS